MANGIRFILSLIACGLIIWILVGVVQIFVIFSNHCFHHCITCLIATENFVENMKRKIKHRRPINGVVVYPVTEALELPHYEGESVTASSTIFDAVICDTDISDIDNII